MLKVEIKNNKSMKLIYNPTKWKKMKYNFQNNLILKDETEKKKLNKKEED